MIHTRICDLLQIEHPILLGGLASFPAPALVAAIVNAGGFAALGCGFMTTPDQVREGAAAVRKLTDGPFGLNFLLFNLKDDNFAAGLALRPALIAFAWARPEQDLKTYVGRAHDAGCKVMVMAPGVPEAKRAAAAGADIIVAQGSEGGGHVGQQASLPLVPMIVDAVTPIPVAAAGGIADGRGLAAALALGAEGAVLGTRLLATAESPLHANFKQAILDSDGHDTQLTEIPDRIAGLVWPGALSRSRRNGLIARWEGREWALRAHQAEALAAVQQARQAGDADNAPLAFGQDAGLIHDIPPAGEVITRMVREAEEILSQRLPGLAGR